MSTVKGILIAIVVIAACVGVAYMAIPERKLENKIDYAVNKIDEESRYGLLKSVEDTCRAMMASYQSDVLTYRQYKTAPMPKSRNGPRRRGRGLTARRLPTTNTCAKTVMYGLIISRATSTRNWTTSSKIGGLHYD